MNQACHRLRSFNTGLCALVLALAISGCGTIPVNGQFPGGSVRMEDIRAGMGGQEVWDLIGKPADISYFPERTELVFSWNFVDIAGNLMWFNVHLDRKAEKVLWTSISGDMKSQPPD